MFNAFVKGTRQLGDPAARRPVWIGLAIALLVFVALWMSIGFLLANTILFQWGWLETVVDVLGGLTTLVVTWFLFPGVISAVIGLLLESIADAVEARHYPHLPAAAGLGLGETVATTLKFLALMVVLNLVMLVFLLFPPVFPFVFYGVNGYLLSREYFELVALRRVDSREARALRKANKGRLFVAGVIIAFLLTVPVVNLLAPVIATATMVHLFESWRQRRV